MKVEGFRRIYLNKSNNRRFTKICFEVRHVIINEQTLRKLVYKCGNFGSECRVSWSNLVFMFVVDCYNSDKLLTIHVPRSWQ